MTLFTKNAVDVFAPNDLSGNARSVDNGEAQMWGTEIEAIANAFVSTGGLIYSSKAAIDADLAHAANSMAWVIGDPVAANNGVYGKVGASGTGSWTRRSGLPFSFIVASDAGAGTANAIHATTAIPVSESALIWMNVFETNTALPVTVSFNGGSALTIKTNSGNNPVVGGLVAGMIVLGIVSGSTFRLVSDQASAAIVAAAEAARDAAEAAQAAAEAAAAGVTLPPIAPNRMLVDNAAGTARESKTFEQVRALLDAVATKLWGSSSLARSLLARWTDEVNLRDWLDTTGAEGTQTANDTALAALITYLNANPTVRKIVGNPGDVYRVTAVNQAFPSGVRLVGNGARFRWSNVGDIGTSVFLSFTNSYVEGLAVDVVSGSAFRRLLQFETSNYIVNCELVSETQINNYGGSLLDWAVRVYRHNNVVRGFKIKNVDRAFFSYGADGDGAPGLNNHFERVTVENYATGMCLRNLDRCKNLSPHMFGRSPNATDDPGFNGILHEGVRRYLLANGQVYDAGEHGVRFGGTRNAEQASNEIVVNGLDIGRSGQSGLKFFTGAVAGRFKKVSVSNVNVVDCQYEPATPAELPGFNDEGFLLQQIEGGVFTNLSVSKQDSITGYSCDCGVYISGATDLIITGLRVDSPYRNMVRIAEWDDGAGSAPVELLDNNGVVIQDAHGSNIPQDGILIDHPTKQLRDIFIRGQMYGNAAVGFYALKVNAAIARFSQPSLVELKSRNFQAGQSNLASSGNWKVRDIYGATY